jgi:type IX secretion system PorP/SprF family membrane protein
MKKLLFILCCVHMSSGVLAQEFNIPIQNQYLAENPFIISAAYAGIGDCWQLRANGITQWVGIDDSPNTQSLSVDGRINDNAGVGLILFNDSNGFTSQRGAQASYAYHLTLNEYADSYLSFGLSYKFTQFGINTAEFNRPD